MKAAYSGIEGSYAGIAASLICPGAERIAFRSFKDAYRSVQEENCDLAILPIENSYAGEVGQVTELMFHGGLTIHGVYELPIRHCLLGVPGSCIEGIRTVVSHPQALEQCGDYIEKNGFKTTAYENTARAARYVGTQNDPAVAAIASKETARIYGLDVLQEDINDSSDNTTRFAVFKKQDIRYNDTEFDPDHKINSILLFTVKHESGTLARALSVLSDFGYNMRMIRSRPLKNRNWEYYFYTEVEGNLFSPKGKQMLAGLQYECGEIKVAGTYEPGFMI